MSPREEKLRRRIIRALEKREKLKKHPKWMRMLPAIGATGGGLIGLAAKKGGSLKSRAIAAALGAGSGATVGWLPQVFRDAATAAKE